MKSPSKRAKPTCSRNEIFHQIVDYSTSIRRSDLGRHFVICLFLSHHKVGNFLATTVVLEPTRNTDDHHAAFIIILEDIFTHPTKTTFKMVSLK